MVIGVPDIGDAFVIFETLNDRGAPLTISDLLRNYLMAQGRDEDALLSIQDSWADVLINLGLREEEDIFVNFLRQYWSSRRGAVREKQLFSAIQSEIEGRTASVRFAADLPPASRFYAALLDSRHELWSGYPPQARASVEALIRLELSQYRPLALAVLEKFEMNEQVRVLRSLVSWAVRGLVVGGVGGGVTERAYCVAATRVRAGEVRTTEDLLRQLLPIVPGDEDFGVEFRRARVSRPGVARYILTALERASRTIQNPELVDDRFDDGVTLRNVLGKSAPTSDWRVTADDSDEIKRLVTRIGNLVLLAEQDPDVGAYVSFLDRRNVFAASSMTLTRSVEDFQVWGKASIEQRQGELAEIALETWPRRPASQAT